MFPWDLARFSFHEDAAGTADAVAARVSTCSRRGPVLVVGAGRPRLLVTLARMGISVIGVDSSRATLTRAREELEREGLLERATLFTADPRDMSVPGGAEAAIVPSLTWRAVVAREGRDQMLACIAKSLCGGGRLCLDLERLPPLPKDGGAVRIRKDQGGAVWSWRQGPHPAVVEVVRDHPPQPPEILELSAQSPEEAVDEVRAAGFRVETLCDPDTGTALVAASQRLWLVGVSDRSAR